MKLLYISTIKENKKETDQLLSIFKDRLGIELEIDFQYDKDFYKTLKSGDKLDILDIYDQMKLTYDWVHIRLTDSNWTSLKLDASLYGQESGVMRNGHLTTITYGRWNEFTAFKQAKYFQDEINGLYEHVLGMLHEYIHSVEGNMSVSHSYLYGYPDLFTKTFINNYERVNGGQFPRNYNNAKLLPALEWVLKKNTLEKLLAELQARLKELVNAKKPETVSYPENFNKAFDIIIKYEGGYANDSNDSGGETNFGISKKAYPTLDIKNLTLETAKEIYYRDYWQASSCDRMSYSVALGVFDMSVNAGVKNSIKQLQTALNITSDGIVGNQTLTALSEANNTLYVDFARERMKYYSSLSSYKTFKNSWINRTFATLSESLK